MNRNEIGRSSSNHSSSSSSRHVSNTGGGGGGGGGGGKTCSSTTSARKAATSSASSKSAASTPKATVASSATNNAVINSTTAGQLDNGAADVANQKQQREAQPHPVKAGERHPPDEVIVLDLSLFDEYGNRTVPVYRRSVRLKFDGAKELQQQQQQSGVSRSGELLPDASLDYHAAVPLGGRLRSGGAAAAAEVTAAWRSRVLDDDVITTVMNTLQAAYPHLLFVNPCITQCVLFAKVKHVPLFLDPLAANKYPNVFFVLNDGLRGAAASSSPSSSSATVPRANSGRHHHGHRHHGHQQQQQQRAASHHWSLLMYDKASKRLFHYDSMRNANYKVAYELSQKVCEYLNAWAVTDVRCEQQTNATDCGYFVVDNMLKLIYLLRNAKHTPPSQIARLPSLVDKTKNYVAYLYERVKPSATAAAVAPAPAPKTTSSSKNTN